MIFATYTTLLQTLGIAIVNSLWQAACVWLLYVAINALFNLSSSKKYLLSVISEAIIFGWFIFSFTNNLFLPVQSYSIKIFAQISSSGKEWMNASVLPFISFIYLIVLTGMMIKWVVNFFYTQKTYKENLLQVETQWQQWIEQKVRQLNIKKSVKIFVTNYIDVPLTIGIVKPFILLPVAITNHLTLEELETILLHELAHIKRADYLINILLSLIETVLYFNPFVFYFKKIIKKERENICDDEVLLQHYSPIQYAESLLKVAKFSLSQKEMAFAMSATNNHQQLLQRIQRITQTQINKKSKFSFTFIFVFLITIFTAFGLLYIPSHNKIQVNDSIKSRQAKSFLTDVIVLAAKQKNSEIKNIPLLNSQKNKQKIPLKKLINENKSDDNLNTALESLKQVNIPALQNNIEEYRKNLSGEEAQQLADNNLKQKIKNYISSKNISINDFIKKVDSIKTNQINSFSSNNQNDNVIIPAAYVEKDSLNQYIRQHQQIKHFIVVPNANQYPYYLIIRSFNEKKEPLFIFIPYKPEQTVD